MALEETTKHVLFQGTTGSGKTMAILTVAESALANSQSVFFVDGKGDPKTINQFKKLTDMYGRKLHVFSEKNAAKVQPNPSW
ncbi:ATP-binding protein [Bacillus sp. WMMC1349]|nr:ATP-binding protein [Bacillus sp. WMMC1349]